MGRLKLIVCICIALAYIFSVEQVQQVTAAVAPDDKNAVSDNPNNIELERLKAKFLPEEFAKSNFTLDDAKRLLRQKCKKAGVRKSDVYEQLEKAAVNLMSCANSIANLTELFEEVEAARPIGELDVVFQKYCDRRPHAEQCLRDFNAQLLPCLSLEERAQNAIVMHILSSLLGFICYKNGDQIALFIAEEGPECLQANKDNIANCMNATFAAYMPKDVLLHNFTELPDLVMGPKQCIDLYDFEECVLGYMEKCNEITPSNIIESMFKYVKNETKCQPTIDKRIAEKKPTKRNGGGGMTTVGTLVSVGGALAALIIFQYYSFLR